jgi:hypothetical protein
MKITPEEEQAKAAAEVAAPKPKTVRVSKTIQYLDAIYTDIGTLGEMIVALADVISSVVDKLNEIDAKLEEQVAEETAAEIPTGPKIEGKSVRVDEQAQCPFCYTLNSVTAEQTWFECVNCHRIIGLS